MDKTDNRQAAQSNSSDYSRVLIELNSLKSELRSYESRTRQAFLLLEDQTDKTAEDVVGFDIGSYLHQGANIFFDKSGGRITINSYSGLGSMAFWVTVKGLTAIVNAGTLRLHSLSKHAVAQTTLNLTGSVAWVYVLYQYNTSTATVTFSASEPDASITSCLMVPLVKLVLNDAGTAYTRDGNICHIGDINFAVPLQNV